MKNYLTEYVRWAGKTYGFVIWERAQKYGQSHQEYLVEEEGNGVFATITAWKGNDFDAWILTPNGGAEKVGHVRTSLLETINEAALRLEAKTWAGQAIRFEPNPETVGNG